LHVHDRVISTIKEILDEHDFSNPEELSVLDEIEAFLNDLSDMYPIVQRVTGLVDIIVRYNFGVNLFRISLFPHREAVLVRPAQERLTGVAL
jgi:hypothetical protein